MTKRILVVEDDNSLSMLLRLIMKIQQEENWELSSAMNGLEALTQVEKYQPDLVLLDIMMPQMDGLEFARRLQAEPRWAKTKVVVLSALSDGSTMRQAHEAGVLEYWTKPISPDELQSGLLRVLGTDLPDLP